MPTMPTMPTGRRRWVRYPVRMRVVTRLLFCSVWAVVVVWGAGCPVETDPFQTPDEFSPSPAATPDAGEPEPAIGDFTVATLDDINTLSTTTAVGGTVSVEDLADIGTATLSSLTTVGGDLIVCHNTGLTSLSFMQLTTVGGDLFICDNADLESASFPLLTTVGGEVKVLVNPALTSLDLSRLDACDGMQFNNAGLPTLTLPALSTSSGDIVIGQANFDANASLTSVAADELTTVSGRLVVQNNTALATLDLSSLELVSDDVVIADNDALIEVDLTLLDNVAGDFCLCRNPLLPACDADAVGESVLAVSVDTSGNNGVCE